MRGKAQLTIRDQPSDRITPAYAGKSAGKKHRTSWSGDHPRLCGEKLHSMVSLADVEGSPPPMRGKVFFFDPQHLRIRITPAYAGKR